MSKWVLFAKFAEHYLRCGVAKLLPFTQFIDSLMKSEKRWIVGFLPLSLYCILSCSLNTTNRYKKKLMGHRLRSGSCEFLGSP